MKRLISAVDKNSIAAELGIQPMDKLVSINGDASFDFLDYFAAMAKDSMEILIEKAQSGEQWLLDVDKDDFEDLGLTFEDGLMDNMMTCRNNCVFCFIQQNPKGVLRDSIYICDDDYRLSYMQGSYISLTNLDERTVKRIISHRISPVNISVHTTDKNRRAYMMGNRRAGRNLKYLEQMARGGIAMGLQIVLCKGLNDEEHLDKTIYDLSRLVLPHGIDGFSLSVVPVGLTKYREENNLPHLRALNDFDCANAIAQVEAWQERFLKELGTRFVFLADEFYLTAGVDLPPYGAYEDFLQIENGVGMMTSFKHDFYAVLDGNAPNTAQALWSPGTKVSLVTGVAAQNFMRGLVPPDIDVKAVRNEFFGENVTVAGLLTGRDIINQLKGRPLGNVLLLPASCLRHGGEVLLDNITVPDIAKELGVRVLPMNTNGGDFAQAIKGGLS
jgi:putative radical SAM enzyme (TIGR03279 family)